MGLLFHTTQNIVINFERCLHWLPTVRLPNLQTTRNSQRIYLYFEITMKNLGVCILYLGVSTENLQMGLLAAEVITMQG